MPTQVTPLLNEIAAQTIIDKIKAEFNTQLTLIDNQYNDGINLEPLKDENIYISDKIETLGLPAVYVLFGNMAFQYTENQNYLDAKNECVVVVTAEDVGAEVLMRKMWRYGRIIYSILNLVNLYDGVPDRFAMNVTPRRMAYSDQRISGKLGSQEKRFRQDCVLELELLHFEKNLTDV